MLLQISEQHQSFPHELWLHITTLWSYYQFWVHISGFPHP